MWTPGYWAYGDDGYYWVPGTWVPAPYEGALWTPGYWGWGSGLYVWHPGYWGRHVGYYGGVNYGFGYMGIGFVGGVWRGGVFAYNSAVMHVGPGIRNTYVDRTIVVRNTIVNNSHVAYSGGRGGINHQPTPQENAYSHERHTAPTSYQTQHESLPGTTEQLRQPQRWAPGECGRGEADRGVTTRAASQPSVAAIRQRHRTNHGPRVADSNTRGDQLQRAAAVTAIAPADRRSLRTAAPAPQSRPEEHDQSPGAAATIARRAATRRTAHPHPQFSAHTAAIAAADAQSHPAPQPHTMSTPCAAIARERRMGAAWRRPRPRQGH